MRFRVEEYLNKTDATKSYIIQIYNLIRPSKCLKNLSHHNSNSVAKMSVAKMSAAKMS